MKPSPLFSLNLLFGAALAATPAQATVTPNGLFTDGAVLQQGQKIPVFGGAADGEAVTVKLGGRTVRTTAQNGRWRADLPPVKAGGPYTLTIAGPSNTVTVQNVLVGEVYLCSGQSNMSFTLGGAATGPQAVAAANDPLLHVYHVPNRLSDLPKTDVGDSGNIHPVRKEPVGRRLALAALGLVYGQKVEYSGPLYDSIRVDSGKIVIQFTHAQRLHTVAVLDGDGKKVTAAGPLTGFTLAGADRKYVNADAILTGDTVVVSSPQIPQPQAVRFGWANYPLVNLYNGAGLPASPFQTDPFPAKSMH